MAAQRENDHGALEIPDERRFVWRNLEAYLTDQLDAEDRERVESFLCECPYTKEYVETEKQFADAVRRCVEEPMVKCPDTLRDKVLAALDNCELEEEESVAGGNGGNVLRFPWVGAVLMAAASVMLVVALVLTFGGNGDEDLPSTLAPMVSRVSLEAPRSEDCRYGEAQKAYREVFADGPALPNKCGDLNLKISDYVVEEVGGNFLVCTVFDCSDGDRFGMMIFKCKCLDHITSEDLMSMEVHVDGKVVILWREGEYYRALVGTDTLSLRRHMNDIRRNA